MNCRPLVESVGHQTVTRGAMPGAENEMIAEPEITHAQQPVQVPRPAIARDELVVDQVQQLGMETNGLMKGAFLK